MNKRILELVQNPELFQLADLELVSEELKNTPYAQSLRALHLFGTHRLAPQQYSQELSITAAYTTDKKILYQLINSLPAENTSQIFKVEQENIPEKEISPAQENCNLKFTAIHSKPIELPKPVYINGELNRILFEGEEDFLERPLEEEIDMDLTIESGQIVTAKKNSDDQFSNDLPSDPTFVESPDAENFSNEEITNNEEAQKCIDEATSSENTSFHQVENYGRTPAQEPEKSKTEIPKPSHFEGDNIMTTNSNLDETSEKPDGKTDEKYDESEDAENFSKETIINEDQLTREKSVVENSAEISFHVTDDFLPKVKIAPSIENSRTAPSDKPTLNKHEEEMNRLVAEVEAKMRAAKKTSKPAEVSNLDEGSEINFSESTHATVISNQKDLTKKDTVPTESPIVEQQGMPVVEENPVDIKPHTDSSWTPMSLQNNMPDSLVKDPNNIEENSSEIVEQKPLAKTDEKIQTIFFENQITDSELLVTEKTAGISANTDNETVAKSDTSNVPVFINTWQNWLQIDRSKKVEAERTKISITEIKNKVIDNFIENEPKISKLKEESDFVIKERNDDISHLMTETLAQLYVEQKLYTKAIKAYQVLIGKHPSKKPHFENKIKEVKELRQNK